MDGVVEHGLCGRFDGVSVVGRCMFAEGQTGETLAQQFENLSFSIV